MFCAGANIRMLAQSSHAWKVNFCKFTNETRNAIEDARETSGQTWIAALNGTAAGGGYELALACDEIVLIDDGSSTVSLPEVPLLGVLPGTGGLTRVVDKRHVRKDRADLFATKSEGYRGDTAVELGPDRRHRRPRRLGRGDRPPRPRGRRAASSRAGGEGVELTPLDRNEDGDDDHLPARDAPPLHRDAAPRRHHGAGPDRGAARRRRGRARAGRRRGTRSPSPASSTTWSCGCAPTSRSSAPGCSAPRATSTACWRTTQQLGDLADDWFVHETTQYLKRTLKRLDVTSRSLVAVIEPGSCFAGFLAELALACDRQYMLDGVYEDVDPDADPAVIVLTAQQRRHASRWATG